MNYTVTPYIVIKGITYTYTKKETKSFINLDYACEYAETIYKDIASEDIFISIDHLENEKWVNDGILDLRAWNIIKRQLRLIRKGR